jgi:hypothetical protein
LPSVRESPHAAISTPKLLNVAVTVAAALMETVQVVAVPLHPPPDQPTKFETEFGEAVRVTELPEIYPPEQVLPQLICPSLLVTVPAPGAMLLTVRV